MSLEEALVATVREPLLVLDEHDRVLLASASFYRHFQLAPDETLGQPLASLGTCQWQTPALRDLLGQLRRSGAPFEDFEISHTFADRGVRTLLLNGRLLAASAGIARGAVLLAFEDVTAQRTLEASRAKAAAELERSNQVLSEFASLAAHDLQEPLRKVQAFGERLSTHAGGRLDERGADYLRRMLMATDRLRTMIDGLLAYARVGREDGPLEAVDLHALVADVIGDLEEQVTRSGGEVRLEPLPVVRGRRHELRQLFQNLIGNALKFHAPDTPPAVRVYVRGADVVVEDSGIGFDQAHAERLFRPFVKAHGGGYDGSGIGLALCRRIVEHLGGTLVAAGRPGAGAQFSVRLPAAPAGQEL